MNLREFLEVREDELRHEIDSLHDRLAPLEAELAEVRRAKGALGLLKGALPSPSPEYESEQIVGVLAQVRRHWPQTEGRGIINSPPAPPGGGIAGFGPAIIASPYQHLTMKQLIVKALEEHFPHGATTREMLDFFRDGWGRDIERTNLSPQIHRLYKEGIIGRVDGTKQWYLVPEGRRGKRPYRVLRKAVHSNEIQPTGEIVWLSPDEVTEFHMPEWQPVPDPDPNED